MVDNTKYGKPALTLKSRMTCQTGCSLSSGRQLTLGNSGDFHAVAKPANTSRDPNRRKACNRAWERAPTRLAMP